MVLYSNVNCNKIVPNELDDIICPFCFKQIKEQFVKNIECCDYWAWKTEIMKLFALLWTNRWL